ncbi:fluoride efflux transporter CrcB [Halobacillus halophilus]|uniref:fluoride efflux transporter CrcB n=1 Tax=Halobacillus halophilus TaxID=1570 RepID=UPI001CD3E71E|nr:fluoride efflux transporter CrcB [Halobacillus halophilus]MCA1011121.1 fluoride efflux transporter CrcB [Halobacillus halophilus]
MRKYIYLGIAFGGGAGSSLRYIISNLLPSHSALPYGTFIVNMLGCFLLSFMYHFFTNFFTKARVLQKTVTTGFIGSFTTFSAFTSEFVQLFFANTYLALIYILGTLLLGGIMTILGSQLGKKWFN